MLLPWAMIGVSGALANDCIGGVSATLPIHVGPGRYTPGVSVDPAEVFRLRMSGHSFRAIATLLGVSLGSVQRALKRRVVLEGVDDDDDMPDEVIVAELVDDGEVLAVHRVSSMTSSARRNR